MKDFITAVLAIVILGVVVLAFAGFLQTATGQQNEAARIGGLVWRVVVDAWNSLA